MQGGSVRGTLLLVATMAEMAAEGAILEEAWPIRQEAGPQQGEMATTLALVCRTSEQEILWTISTVVVDHLRARVSAANQVAVRGTLGNSVKTNSMDPLQVTVPPQAGVRRRERFKKDLSPWVSKS